ncbi:PfkB family carbohydrate kinase [Macrococcoides caseolyticum]|uniref:PfkB family carbohydrate kinase n=1 Tax=Macrococcoides caseolyticum TaxID=69966 RepID=UPI003F646439
MVTLGDEGSVFYNGQLVNAPSIKVGVVDTTGAGDTFNGALGGALSEGMALDDAMKSIKNKKLDATIAQQPALMGEDAVKAILDLKDGKKIKSEVKVPLKLVEQ